MFTPNAPNGSTNADAHSDQDPSHTYETYVFQWFYYLRQAYYLALIALLPRNMCKYTRTEGYHTSTRRTDQTDQKYQKDQTPQTDQIMETR